MDMCHQQFRAANELAMLLPFDGTHSDGTAFIDIEAVGLSCVHLGMSRAVAVQGALADLRVDASRDEESDVDVVVFQFQRLIKPEQGMLGRTIRRPQRKSEQAR